MNVDVLQLKDKVALVTGGSRGIGKAIVKDLMEQGAAVAFTYANSTEKAKALEGELSSLGTIKGYQSDASNLDNINQLTDAIEKDFGKVDILINNAGRFVSKPFDEVTEDEFEQLFATNVKGPFFLVQKMVRLIPEGGRVINISSGSTQHYVPMSSIYAASKGALEQFTRTWARELSAKKITVNSLLPGYTATDWVSDTPEEQMQWMAGQAALGELGTAEDISRAVLFLASDLGRWVTGQQLSVDGGL
ncbi:SDR family NAD(P)-dependent oxidoreductase [Acaryochloris marina]|uniref:Oxidoreductase, short chain dehydrogenase/reductase family protein n=1 Tax=Acaryochloris marina (strain MBIC 11017) TaxID=329726 RepID=B0C4T7_ACAM1|nr:SDR family oxidoreductase [Acaryochloris marina]ABW31075.1 oxidoreductase, short chain dehydrogenase/reductase family protein [Acaryochloris marina MBIC11017]BDM79788.1 3-ketoacyl-ACP reductase [Acaryochloris marina MBIC10699]